MGLKDLLRLSPPSPGDDPRDLSHYLRGRSDDDHHRGSDPRRLQQTFFGAWRSSVARLLWEQEVPGSNPGAPTRKIARRGCTPGSAKLIRAPRLLIERAPTPVSVRELSSFPGGLPGRLLMPSIGDSPNPSPTGTRQTIEKSSSPSGAEVAVGGQPGSDAARCGSHVSVRAGSDLALISLRRSGLPASSRIARRAPQQVHEGTTPPESVLREPQGRLGGRPGVELTVSKRRIKLPRSVEHTGCVRQEGDTVRSWVLALARGPFFVPRCFSSLARDGIDPSGGEARRGGRCRGNVPSWRLDSDGGTIE